MDVAGHPVDVIHSGVACPSLVRDNILNPLAVGIDIDIDIDMVHVDTRATLQTWTGQADHAISIFFGVGHLGVVL